MNTYLRIKQMRNYQKFFTKMLKKQENINNEKVSRDLGEGFNINFFLDIIIKKKYKGTRIQIQNKTVLDIFKKIDTLF